MYAVNQVAREPVQKARHEYIVHVLHREKRRAVQKNNVLLGAQVEHDVELEVRYVDKDRRVYEYVLVLLPPHVLGVVVVPHRLEEVQCFADVVRAFANLTQRAHEQVLVLAAARFPLRGHVCDNEGYKCGAVDYLHNRGQNLPSVSVVVEDGLILPLNIL